MVATSKSADARTYKVILKKKNKKKNKLQEHRGRWSGEARWQQPKAPTPEETDSFCKDIETLGKTLTNFVEKAQKHRQFRRIFSCISTRTVSLSSIISAAPFARRSIAWCADLPSPGLHSSATMSTRERVVRCQDGVEFSYFRYIKAYPRPALLCLFYQLIRPV